MGIFDFFKRNRKSGCPVTEVQPESKRDYKSAPGRYNPKTDLVRLANVAQAAGVSYDVAKHYADALGMPQQMIKSRLYVDKLDALELHRILWDYEKA